MLITKNGRRYWVLPALLVVSMVLLAACGPQAVPTAADVPADATTIAASTNAPAGSASATPASSDAAGATDTLVSFKKDVLPILQNRCVKCHGGQKTEKNFNVTDYQHLMAGAGADGPMIVASDAAKSKLIQMVQSGKMPKMSAKLLPAQIQILIDWVNQGAQDN